MLGTYTSILHSGNYSSSIAFEYKLLPLTERSHKEQPTPIHRIDALLLLLLLFTKVVSVLVVVARSPMLSNIAATMRASFGFRHSLRRTTCCDFLLLPLLLTCLHTMYTYIAIGTFVNVYMSIHLV